MITDLTTCVSVNVSKEGCVNVTVSNMNRERAIEVLRKALSMVVDDETPQKTVDIPAELLSA